MSNTKAKIRVVSYIEVDIHQARIENNLTLREAAKKLGWDSSNLSKMERGLLPMSEDQLQHFSKTISTLPI